MLYVTMSTFRRSNYWFQLSTTRTAPFRHSLHLRLFPAGVTFFRGGAYHVSGYAFADFAAKILQRSKVAIRSLFAVRLRQDDFVCNQT